MEARNDVVDTRRLAIVIRVTAGIERAGREMQDVEDDEDEQQHAAPSHRPRRERRNLRPRAAVADRPRRVTLPRELSTPAATCRINATISTTRSDPEQLGSRARAGSDCRH